MTGLVRAELGKVLSTRLWWALLIGALLYSGISAVANGAFAGVEAAPGQPALPGLETAEGIRSVYAGSMFAGTYIFALVLGVTGMTGEYRYQTVTATFLVSPRRARVVLAKMAAHLLMGVGYGVAALVVTVTAGAVVIAVRGFDLGLGTERLWPTLGLAVLAVAAWTVLGIGIGTLVRNQVAAIVVAVLITFLLEPLATVGLGALGWDGLVRWLPTNASTALMAPGGVYVEYLEWWVGGLVLLGYAAVLAGLGLVLSLRRDVT